MQKSKLIFIIILLAILVFGVFLISGILRESNQQSKVDSQALIDFDPEIERALTRHMTFVMSLTQDETILEVIKSSNYENENVSVEEIAKLDQQWLEPENLLIQKTFKNVASKKLVEFQEEYPDFSEIFITDRQGFNVAQTNKTSDYYQADELWWIQAYNNGSGFAHHGPIEFDESAQVEAIALYAPVFDPGTQHAIGVIKAVLSVAAIKIDL